MDRSYSCNSNGGSDNACSALLDKIRKIDFALYDTVLYLDVYPDSREALEYYHKLKQTREELIAKHQASCGPLTAFGNTSAGSWNWLDNPWPWFPEANK